MYSTDRKKEFFIRTESKVYQLLRRRISVVSGVTDDCVDVTKIRVFGSAVGVSHLV